jgi:nucleolar protein 53
MAETTVSAPATHSQPSRKGKKAWRKNVDLTQVQDGLESVRAEIIQTGGVIAERPAEELFTTDVAGDEEIAKKIAGRKQLKCEEIIAQRSAVPGLEGRKKRKLDDVMVPGSSKRTKNGTYITHKELQRLRRVADGVNGEMAVEGANATHDPWAPVTVVKDPRLNYLEEAKAKRAPETLKQAPVSLTANNKPIPSVPKPAPGKSYNPLVTDWSELLEREGAAAVEAEKARLQAEAEAAEREARAKAEAEKVEQQERDAYGTDYESAWESEWEGIKSGAEEEESYVKKAPRRKTPQERKKIKARKEREARERWEKKQKEREAEEKRIAQIAKEMSAKDKAARKKQALTTAAEDSSASDIDDTAVTLKPRRFGALPLPDAPLEVVLPEELPDSLRRLKPEGSLLTDRYRNMLINGKVEVHRHGTPKSQYKQKKTERTEKWSYKDWKLK